MITPIQYGNSGITIFSYKGQSAIQKMGVHEAFDKLYQNTKQQPFKRVIEIGTDYGGLTNFLADHPLSDRAEVYTYDINPHRFVSHNSKIKFIVKDVFAIQEELGELISSSGRTLLLCDGGNKREEFKTFHKYLKPDDVIMAHDYAPNKEVFEEQYINKIWNWQEFQDSYADFLSLEPYLQDIFANYAWCIRIKTK